MTVSFWGIGIGIKTMIIIGTLRFGFLMI